MSDQSQEDVYGYEPECPSEDCMMCSGEACNFCGAGCWNNDPDRPLCEHDVMERHCNPDGTFPPV